MPVESHGPIRTSTGTLNGYGRKIPYIKVSNRVRFLYSDVLAFLTENCVLTLEKSR
jgi:hypothetical protein